MAEAGSVVAVAGLAVFPKIFHRVILPVIDRTKVVEEFFDQVVKESRTIKIKVRNSSGSSHVLTDCKWHVQQGYNSGMVKTHLNQGETSHMEFRKNKINCYGVSGFIEFTYARTKKVIVRFSVPMRRNRKGNTVIVALLDESKLSLKEKCKISNSDDFHVFLKQLTKQTDAIRFAKSYEGGRHGNPTISDGTIKVTCNLTGGADATLNVRVSRSRI